MGALQSQFDVCNQQLSQARADVDRLRTQTDDGVDEELADVEQRLVALMKRWTRPSSIPTVWHVAP